MSVAYFESDELANVALIAASCLYGPVDQGVAQWAPVLEEFSRANAAAYHKQYPAEPDTGHATAEEITALALRPRAQPQFVRACRSVRLMEYNTITGNGDELATAELRSHLLELATLLLGAAADKLNNQGVR